MSAIKIDYIKPNGEKVGFTPSEEQMGIFNEIENGIGNIVVNAVAGSGKTSTAVNAIKLIPKEQRIVFLAFNKEIVKELTKRIENACNIEIMTCHSMGLKFLNKHYGKDFSLKLDSFKYKAQFNKFTSNYTHITLESLGNKQNHTLYTSNIFSLLDFARLNHCQTIEEINNIGTKYDIIQSFNESEVVLKLMEWGKEELNLIDFIDMVWLPIENNLSGNFFKKDWIIVDECQDLSIIQQKLFQKCIKRGTRCMMIGDRNQAIYSFAGADEHSFNNLTKLPNTKTFNLSVSYRCPQKVVALAQKIVPSIKYKENALVGRVSYDVSHHNAQYGDMVLCRTTYPLAQLYITYLRTNKKCFMRGKDIGKNLIDLIKETKEEQLYKTLMGKGVFSKLYFKLFTLRDKVIEQYGLSLEDAFNSPQVSNLYDSIKTIDVLSEGVKTALDLINKIEHIFLDSDGDGVCLSTIHKAKGLEADNIYILCPSLIPIQYAKKDWELQSERNLEYVAITRALKTLNYVSENDFPPPIKFNGDNGEDYKKINEIQKTISLLYSHNFIEDITNANNDKQNIRRSSDIEGIFGISTSIKTTNTSKRKAINKVSKFL